MSVSRFFGILLIFFFLGAGVFFFRFDPAPFRPSIEHALAQSLKVPVRIQKVTLEKKFPFDLIFEGLEFSETGGNDFWFRAEQARAGIDFSAFVSWPLSLAFKKILLENSVLKIRRDPKGGWNFRMPPFASNVPGISEAGPVLTFKQAKLDYQDASASPLFSMDFDFEGTARSVPAGGMHFFFTARFRGRKELPLMLLKAHYVPDPQAVSFELKQAEGKWNLQGELHRILEGDNRFKLSIETRSLDLAKTFPEYSTSREAITGLMTAHLEGYGEGTHPHQIMRTLVMDGAIDLREGSFHHLNFLKEILAGLSPIPSFSNAVKSELRGAPGEFFQAEDLPFDMLRAGIHMAQGNLAFQEGLISQETAYIIEGEGNWALPEHSVDFNGKLVLFEEFSGALALQAREWMPLRNEKGRILVPFKYRGLLPGASVYPDLNYVAAATQLFQKEREAQVLPKNEESQKS